MTSKYLLFPIGKKDAMLIDLTRDYFLMREYIKYNMAQKRRIIICQIKI